MQLMSIRNVVVIRFRIVQSQNMYLIHVRTLYKAKK